MGIIEDANGAAVVAEIFTNAIVDYCGVRVMVAGNSAAFAILSIGSIPIEGISANVRKGIVFTIDPSAITVIRAGSAIISDNVIADKGTGMITVYSSSFIIGDTGIYGAVFYNDI
jgi:hypothetical protein